MSSMADAPDGGLARVKKGDWVRLLEPHYDGFQLIPRDAVVRWWNDAPPKAGNVALPDPAPLPDHQDPYAGKRPFPL